MMLMYDLEVARVVYSVVDNVLLLLHYYLQYTFDVIMVFERDSVLL